MAENPQVRISVTGGGSGTGIASLINGTIQIANASREMSAEEIARGEEERHHAREVHRGPGRHRRGGQPANPVQRPDPAAALRHVHGQDHPLVASVGGEDRPVVLLSRESNSGTYVYFLEQVVRLGNSKSKALFSPETLLMPSSEGISAEVRQNPNAIGYDGLGYVTPDQKMIAVARTAAGPYVLPSVRTVLDKTYPVSRPLFMYTAGEPTGAVKEYLDWVMGDGQKLVTGRRVRAAGGERRMSTSPIPGDVEARPSARGGRGSPSSPLETLIRVLGFSTIGFVLPDLPLPPARRACRCSSRCRPGSLFSTRWYPTFGIFGTLPLILGSILVTLLAIVIALPLGVATAVFVREVAPRWAREILKPIIEVLAGIPSVVLGFFGMTFVAPLVREVLGAPTGLTAFSGAFILAYMALPTIISVAEDALDSVPKSYRDAGLAMGATRWQTIWRVVVPAARSGILTAVMLGMGRAIGETMAVMMVTGNAAVLPTLAGVAVPARCAP